jgi:ABC-type glycerol-3-phosphate transport system permease component
MSVTVPASRTRREATLAPNYIILVLLLVFSAGPLLVLGFNSLKTQAELGRNPLGPPQSFMWENFPKAWDLGNFSLTTGGWRRTVSPSSICLVPGPSPSIC